jgi:hypothetical protein
MNVPSVFHRDLPKKRFVLIRDPFQVETLNHFPTFSPHG